MPKENLTLDETLEKFNREFVDDDILEKHQYIGISGKHGHPLYCDKTIREELIDFIIQIYEQNN